ncbi:MAG TPA: MoaD/ThiS family protein [Abditibacteriaceae bacterium]|jgi:molybdopterin converting factor small subunit
MRESDRTFGSEECPSPSVRRQDEPHHASSPSLEIPVLLFAGLKEAAGADLITVRVPQTSSTAKVTLDLFLTCCCRQYPKLEPWMPYVKVAVNCEYSQREKIISADDEIALLPPVSGGAFFHHGFFHRAFSRCDELEK